MQIIVKVIPHNEQRYKTIGDWWFELTADGDILQIRVSDMENTDYEMLVALHEQVEALLCRQRKIKEKDVSAFDIAFEKKRKRGNTDEPGDASDAPYRKEHFFATSIERLISAEFKVDWKEYDNVINSL